MQVQLDNITENRPIRDIAYEQLKHAIITGQISAGSRIIETVYADRMHISRTPLREALHRLEEDGLVECTVHRGVIVKAFTISDIEEIFLIRNAMMMMLLPSIVNNVTEDRLAELKGILQKMDVALANDDVEKLAVYNRAFHHGIEKLSDKKRVLKVIADQEEYIKRFSAIAIASITRRSESHNEHWKMLELLTKRDLEGLKELMHHHLEESKMTCLSAVQDRGY